MMGINQYDSFLDTITVASFILGILNYEENIDQSTLESTIQSAIDDVHHHLELQDAKIDAIMAKLGIKEEDI